MKTFSKLLLGLALCTASALPALADTVLPLLKPQVTVASEIITVGDLFDHPGLEAETAIFRAPDIGTRGTVAAADVAAAMKAAGISEFDLGGLTEVSVTRESRLVSTADFKEFVTEAIANAAGIADARRLSISFDVEPEAVHVSPTVRQPLRLAGLSYSRINGRFEALVEPALPDARPLRLSGMAIELFEIAVLTRTLGRGETIRQEDVSFERVPRNRLPREAVVDVGSLVGLAARRPIAAGTALKAEDFRAPFLVQRNDAVTVVYAAGGISLTARGQVLDSGAMGDLVSVRNTQSKKILQATVSGPGLVTVESAGGRLAAVMGGVQ